MKRIVTTLCALAVIMVGSIPAMAAEEPPRQDASYYPISVDEYTYGELEEPRINKVYQLSLSDDPSLIPTEDFERDGLWFTLLDMTRKNEVGVDTQPYTETVTRPSKTNDMAQVLQALEAEMEVTTAEGYAGTLHLDHTSVQVKTDGYRRGCFPEGPAWRRRSGHHVRSCLFGDGGTAPAARCPGQSADLSAEPRPQDRAHPGVGAGRQSTGICGVCVRPAQPDHQCGGLLPA